MPSKVSFLDVFRPNELAELISRLPESFEPGFSVQVTALERKLPAGLVRLSEKERTYLLGIDQMRRPVTLCLSLKPGDDLFLEALDTCLWEKANPWVFQLLLGEGEKIESTRSRLVLASQTFSPSFLERVGLIENSGLELFEIRVVILGDSEKRALFSRIHPTDQEQFDSETLPAFFSRIEPDKLRNLAMRATGRIQRLFPGVLVDCRGGKVFIEASGREIASIQGGRGYLEISLDGETRGPVRILEDSDLERIFHDLTGRLAGSQGGGRPGLVTPEELRSLAGAGTQAARGAKER